MAKYSLEFKQQVVEYYLSGKDSLRLTADRFGTTHSQVRQWAARYKAHAADGLKKRFTHYSPDFKYQAVQLVLSGSHSISEASIRLNIPAASSLLHWIRLYNEGGIDALQSKQRGQPKMSQQEKSNLLPEKPLEEMTREELLKELQYRRAEVAYLKKLDALIQSRKSAAKTKRGS